MNALKNRLVTRPSCPQLRDDDDVAVLIEENGDVVFVHDDNILQVLRSALGEVNVQRASRIEHDGYAWYVDVSPLTGGPEQIVAMTNRRDEALAAEVDWLKNYLEGSNAQTVALSALPESESG